MASSSIPSTSARYQTYEARLPLHSNPSSRALLETVIRKRSNLSVSVDVTTKKELLEIVEAVGEFVVCVKTHCDIVDDWDQDLVDQLTALSKKLDFQIFEDRKFADIGNTVQLQYSSGHYKIASWAHMTNAHPLPGPGIVSGLASVGLPLGRSLILLAQMSSAGMLATGEYTKEAVRMAAANPDFVVGFIAQSRVEELLPAEEIASLLPEGRQTSDFLILTPGIGLAKAGDKLGQQYRSPQQVVGEDGCDIIIVGRGIYGGAGRDEWRREAERYRAEGWKAYEERIRKD